MSELLRKEVKRKRKVRNKFRYQPSRNTKRLFNHDEKHEKARQPTHAFLESRSLVNSTLSSKRTSKKRKSPPKRPKSVPSRRKHTPLLSISPRSKYLFNAHQKQTYDDFIQLLTSYSKKDMELICFSALREADESTLFDNFYSGRKSNDEEEPFSPTDRSDIHNASNLSNNITKLPSTHVVNLPSTNISSSINKSSTLTNQVRYLNSSQLSPLRSSSQILERSQSSPGYRRVMKDFHSPKISGHSNVSPRLTGDHKQSPLAKNGPKNQKSSPYRSHANLMNRRGNPDRFSQQQIKYMHPKKDSISELLGTSLASDEFVNPPSQIDLMSDEADDGFSTENGHLESDLKTHELYSSLYNS